MKEITIIRPDDWHLHVRDGGILEVVVPYTAKVFKRAIIMPNLDPPITTVEQCAAYRQRILDASPEGFEPLMTLYMTEDLPPACVEPAKATGFIHGIKMYPRHSTTLSGHGVADVQKVFPVFEAMEKYDLPLLIHGEHISDDIDIFDREKVFIDKSLTAIRKEFSQLRIVFEHITTADAVEYVKNADPQYLAATITPHHLLYTRNSLFDGGIRPHHYCLPLPQREVHRRALVAAATSGDAHFFAGTDSAPHHKDEKESSCGCAGIFNAPVALPAYAWIFDQADRLDNLEQFVSLNGPAFYKLPHNEGRIRLRNESVSVPETIEQDAHCFVPLLAKQEVPWSIQN